MRGDQIVPGFLSFFLRAKDASIDSLSDNLPVADIVPMIHELGCNEKQTRDKDNQSVLRLVQHIFFFDLIIESTCQRRKRIFYTAVNSDGTPVKAWRKVAHKARLRNANVFVIRMA